MLAFPGMLVDAAKQAGMKTPEDPDKVQWDISAYPHFTVFCNLQLGRAMSSWSEHWENAKIIAAIPEEKLFSMLFEDYLALGLHCVL